MSLLLEIPPSLFPPGCPVRLCSPLRLLGHHLPFRTSTSTSPSLKMVTSSLSSTTRPSADASATDRRRERILSSKLYFDIQSPKVPVIYSSAYDISFLGIEKLHPFDSSKWGRICQFLINDGVLKKEQIVEPLEASKDDLLVVHSEDYLKSLKNSLNVAMIVEVPLVALLPNCLVQKNVLYPFRKQVGGTILAAKLATERLWAINIGGGFHHCSGERGGGFCAYADISLCIRFAFVCLEISRVMIIDLDAHQGNGHELDFAKESKEGTVYILDMYNADIYPFDFKAKESIKGKVELESGTNTEEYMEKLEKALKDANAFDPDLIVYNAGTDVLDGDPLGHLKVTPEGVIARDERVFRFAKTKCKPLVMVTSGGYMKSNAGVIAKSIRNLYEKNLIDLSIPQG